MEKYSFRGTKRNEYSCPTPAPGRPPWQVKAQILPRRGQTDLERGAREWVSPAGKPFDPRIEKKRILLANPAPGRATLVGTCRARELSGRAAPNQANVRTFVLFCQGGKQTPRRPIPKNGFSCIDQGKVEARADQAISCCWNAQ